MGAIVSSGMIFGFAYGRWGMAVVAIDRDHRSRRRGARISIGILVAYIGFPALIATLATYYA